MPCNGSARWSRRSTSVARSGAARATSPTRFGSTGWTSAAGAGATSTRCGRPPSADRSGDDFSRDLARNRRQFAGRSGGGGEEVAAAGLVGGDVGVVLQGEADVVEAVEQAVLGEVVQGEGAGDSGGRCLDGAALDVDRDLE